MSKTRTKKKSDRGPEKRFGPYPGGISVAIWRNTVETADGTKTFRSFTVSPRRYRDDESGEWRDSASYRPADIATLMFALGQAQEFILTAPREDSEANEEEEQEDF